MDNDTVFWVGISRIEGLGVRGAHKLVCHFGSPKAAYMASLTELESSGLSAAVCQSIFSQAGLQEAEKEIEAAAKSGCQLINYEDPAYPSHLRQIADPPLVLYVKGDLRALSGHCLAIVGSRRPSAYGLQIARRLARDLAERNLVIVSGLARGIDSAAHHGALEAKGKTIAVQGRGMDGIYPAENRRLADKIVESGAIISEFPLGTGPTPENFPIRNRVISGLSLGVMVVEASEYSGSLITARLATEHNREVFAVPGNITSAQSFGPNHLIKQGAKLVGEWIDVVEEFSPDVRMQLLPSDEASDGGRGIRGSGQLFDESLTQEQKKVFEALRVDESLFVDSILGSVPLPQAQVMQALLELEMGGLVRQLPGKNFIRKL
ncbi:MAG TPA: DNA-processing protein DprA [Terriglobia bacterium]|nr:DNA-processing protein DprA [Terriglobia bacterium]